MSQTPHISVLCNELLAHVSLSPGDLVVDATLGAAGHSSALAKMMDGDIHLLGIDQDLDAIAIATEKLNTLTKQYTGFQYQIVQSNFESIDTVCKAISFGPPNLILADLGISSMHVDRGDRGFSYRKDAPLDMRMDQSQGIPLSDWLLQATEQEMKQIIWKYGEERFSGRIAHKIVQRREDGNPIVTTLELSDLIESCYPQKSRKTHPARKTFQAFRIFLNRELEVLETFLEKSFDLLPSGGQLAIISFHSIEDRMVKYFFKKQIAGCICPPDVPFCQCGILPKAHSMKRYLPSDQELEDNPRSRSAILRVITKS